jgi:hypothetical protein
VNAVEELKLTRDVEEMKSKLHVLELKLNEVSLSHNLPAQDTGALLKMIIIQHIYDPAIH